MSKTTRNKLSVMAWGGAIFCAAWLLLSAQAAVDHFNQRQTSPAREQSPAWTVRGLTPDNTN